MKKVIVTGDDFGLAVPINEAIIEAHEKGVLTTASLMVGGEAAADAIRRAQQLPSLRVGMHLVLVEGRPILPREIIPDLVDDDGQFQAHLFRAGVNYFFRPGIHKQLESEIRAQFDAFRDTGLLLDHVNAHNHFHLHPTVFNLLLKVGRDYGLKSVRFPHEPPLLSWRCSKKGLVPKLANHLLLAPWMILMKKRLRRAHMRFNDFIFGFADSGAMTTDLVLRFLGHLPEGVTEIYFHPSKRRCPEIDRTMSDYRHEEEFGALVSKRLREEFQALSIQRIAFSDL
jgi:hopanoid biosynthesis associated protein HpnK